MKSILLAVSLVLGLTTLTGCASVAPQHSDQAISSRAGLSYTTPHSALARHGRVSMLRERTGEKL